MIEKILEIREVENSSYEGADSWFKGDGFLIKTDKQEIKILISNSQDCCEQWGYFCANDDFKDYIGAELNNIKFVDDCLNKKILDQKLEYGIDEGEIKFIILETSKGDLQFSVYNNHNGYYGHSACVISKQLKEEFVL